MRIAVTGSAGRLGSAICAELVSAGHSVVALRRSDLDITNAGQVASLIARLQPDVIVNCSAYNSVDAAETDRSTAFAINALGPSLLADAAEATGALLVHFSTDFVFDGMALVPYSETDATNPLSVYGSSKLAGEVAVRRTARHYVLRLESLFGGSSETGRRATVDYIADGLLAGLVVRAAVDRTVSPGYVPDVARATAALLERQPPYGLYHCVNSGHTTWHELAKEVGRVLGIAGCIEPVMTAELQATAARPRFCALANGKLRAAGIDMPGWPSAIHRHLRAAARLRLAHAVAS